MWTDGKPLESWSNKLSLFSFVQILGRNKTRDQTPGTRNQNLGSNFVSIILVRNMHVSS